MQEDALENAGDAERLVLEKIEIKPRKSDINVTLVALAGVAEMG